MAEKGRVVVRLSRGVHAQVKRYAEQKGLDVGPAVDALVTTAIKRLAAVNRYAKAKREER